MQIILGIDPGIADTGFGVIEKSKSNTLRCVEYGSIQTSSKLDLSDRLELLGIELGQIIKKHKPEIVSIEQLFFCNNAKTALIVGHARGVVMYVAKQNNVPIVEYTPLQIKQAVAAYGKADKKQVQRMVKMILNLKEIPKPDDAADGLAAAICASNSI